ncbi:MAG: twin-arginine translocase subunit TatC, partial [Planctomycetota bacterium]|nr:twin-arginine translocase subunit TatC [Planctomycetota bacterium]
IRDAVEQPEALPRMTFGDHLDELRRRVIKALLAVVGAVLLVLPFKGTVQEIIVGPYRQQWKIGFEGWVEELQAREAAGEISEDSAQFLDYCLKYQDQIYDGTVEYPYLLQGRTGYPVPYGLYATGGLEDILSFMWASLIFAVVLASPIVIWQIWAFIASGLYRHERRVFYRYFPFMVLLTCAGVWFGYAVALPYSLGFLISMMDPSMVNAIFSVGQFFNLLFMTTAAMGVVFQVPIVMLALQRVGLVRHATFVKHWRMTVLIIFILSALFSPPEPVSMILMSLPMILLYGVGLILTASGRKNEPPAPEISA